MARPPEVAQSHAGADDLDDGLELDADLLASSDDQEEEAPGGNLVEESGGYGDSGEGVAENGEVYVALAVNPDFGARGRKRRADQQPAVNEAAVKAEKKRRIKEREKERKAKVSIFIHLCPSRGKRTLNR